VNKTDSIDLRGIPMLMQWLRKSTMIMMLFLHHQKGNQQN